MTSWYFTCIMLCLEFCLLYCFPLFAHWSFLSALNSKETSFSQFFQRSHFEKLIKASGISVVFSLLADMQWSLLCSAFVMQLYSLYVIFSSVLGPHVGSIFGRSRSHCFLLLVCGDTIEMSQERLQQCKECGTFWGSF